MRRGLSADAWRRWKEFAAALLGAGGSLAVVLGILGQPVASVVSLVVAIAGAAVPLVIAFGLRSADARRETFELDDRLLAPIAPVPEVNAIEIGVDPAAREETHLDTDLPDYLWRNADEELDGALQEALDGSGRWIVVIHGLSKVGKSRTLFEGLRRRCEAGEDIRLVAPKDGDALRALLEQARPPRLARIGIGKRRRYVLWLDDLEDFAAEGVGIRALQAWRRRLNVVVVATYGGKGSERDFGKKGRRRASDLSAGILSQAQRVGLQATNAEELRRLPASLAAVDRKALAIYGLAATVVAGPALLVKLDSQQHRAGDRKSPVGAAIVYTVINWERCGRSDPIPEVLLRELWPSHLWPAHMKESTAATDEEFESGLKWALEPVAGSVSLLRGIDSFQAYDYVRRAVGDNPDSPAISEETWGVALETDDPRQAFAVGTAALAAGRTEEAERALAFAGSEGDEEVAAPANLNLGLLLRDVGEPEEADVAFERAKKLGSPTSEIDRVLEEWVGPDEMQKAAIEGQLRDEGLLDKGKIVWAEDRYREEVEEGKGESAADLAMTLWARGEHEEAKAAFERAIALGFVPASVGLGILLERMDDLEGAEGVYEFAMNHDIAEGAYNLGVLRKDMGDIPGSEEALDRAAQLGHYAAASNLGVLLAMRGDLAAAETAFRQAMEGGVAEGAVNLGNLLEEQGRPKEAEEALATAKKLEEASPEEGLLSED
jgi:tetratricopeptide (TPR) repeat protein